MKIRNKSDKAFGPVGSSAGIFLFVAGLVITYFSLTGMLLVVVGAFVGFTSTSTTIDFDKKRLRFSNNIFGIIPIGQWISIRTDMKIKIRKSNSISRDYSWGDRAFDIADKDYSVILFDSNGKEIMQLQKFDNLDSAKLNLYELSRQLGIGVNR
jgi:hypothetical protein